MKITVRKLAATLGVIAVLIVGYTNRGWPGFFMALGGVVFIALLYINRILRILRAAGQTPKGRISSAVMLNARLQAGMTMLEVIRETRALSEPQSPIGEGLDEVHRWVDPGGAWVDCVFRDAKLISWSLGRPPEAAQAPSSSPVPEA